MAEPARCDRCSSVRRPDHHARIRRANGDAERGRVPQHPRPAENHQLGPPVCDAIAAVDGHVARVNLRQHAHLRRRKHTADHLPDDRNRHRPHPCENVQRVQPENSRVGAHRLLRSDQRPRARLHPGLVRRQPVTDQLADAHRHHRTALADHTVPGSLRCHPARITGEETHPPGRRLPNGHPAVGQRGRLRHGHAHVHGKRRHPCQRRLARPGAAERLQRRNCPEHTGRRCRRGSRARPKPDNPVRPRGRRVVAAPGRHLHARAALHGQRSRTHLGPRLPTRRLHHARHRHQRRRINNSETQHARIYNPWPPGQHSKPHVGPRLINGTLHHDMMRRR
ncbi:conserved hypothetical protein [Leifsonia xyli subsp. xyli str. CTCB07]|uniref:Uncharacterized protein n=1 Tax=Leifsonia xyli subsp. xyli (strain CTCB07) TaxID=281090 RepID=Q6AC39_LEIXX|nr:conserved hypothetical protein [Leifsonia xyli subsp. xyli str. CTCB07]